MNGFTGDRHCRGDVIRNSAASCGSKRISEYPGTGSTSSRSEDDFSSHERVGAGQVLEEIFLNDASESEVYND